MLPNVSSAPAPVPDLLLADTELTAAKYLPVLRELYRVTVVSTMRAALDVLDDTAPALVIAELDLSDGPSEEICTRAKALETPPTVLVMTPQAERVPTALAAGCDGVLLKPFAPNLLYARIGRLLRARSIELRVRAHRQLAKASHLHEQSDLLSARSNREWPTTHCPYCQHCGVTSFEYSSHRRSWYACLACRKVWIARRLE